VMPAFPGKVFTKHSLGSELQISIQSWRL